MSNAPILEEQPWQRALENDPGLEQEDKEALEEEEDNDEDDVEKLYDDAATEGPEEQG